MTLRDLLEEPDVDKHVPTAEIPVLLGELEKLKVALWARLLNPTGKGQLEHRESDRRLSVGEAAVKLGVSKDYLYRHADTLPFTIRIGRGLGFSETGIERYLRHRAGR